jgi:hypothetical protein
MKQTFNQFWARIMVVSYLLTSCLNPEYKSHQIPAPLYQEHSSENPLSSVSSSPPVTVPDQSILLHTDNILEPRLLQNPSDETALLPGLAPIPPINPFDKPSTSLSNQHTWTTTHQNDSEPHSLPSSNTLSSYFTTKSGHQVRFYQRGQAHMAKIKRNLPVGFTQNLHLPIYIAKNFIFNTLDQQSFKYIERHTHICFPEQDHQTRRGYVYIDHHGLQGGATAKTSAGLKGVSVTHQGPFYTTHPTNEHIAVQSIEFVPQEGFWWAKITYLSHSVSTKRWKTHTAPICGPVETDTPGIVYAEDISRAQVTIDYAVEDAQANRPVPVFRQIHIQKTEFVDNIDNSDQIEGKQEEGQEYELELAELEGIQEAAYKDFMQALQRPREVDQILSNNQVYFESILDRMTAEDKMLQPELESKAEIQVFADYLAKFIQMLQARHQATYALYLGSDTSDYINQHMGQGIRDLNKLEEQLETSKQQLHIINDVLGLEAPALHAKPLLDVKTIFKPFATHKILVEILNVILETKVPGGKLLQVILGTVDQPETWEQWLPIALETALDFIPGGKAAMFMNFLNGKSTKTEIKKLLIKQAKKKVKQMNQENKQQQKLKDKKAEKEHLIKPNNQLIKK